MSLVEDALRLAMEEQSPSKFKEYKHLSIDEIFIFLKNNFTLEQIEEIQGRMMDLMESDLQYKYPIEAGEYDESVPLPKFDELEDPSPYNPNHAGYANRKDDD